MSEPMSLETLTYAMGEVWKQIEEVKTILNDFIKAANNNYATKEDVVCIKWIASRLDKLENRKRKVIWIFSAVSVVACLLWYFISIISNYYSNLQ